MSIFLLCRIFRQTAVRLSSVRGLLKARDLYWTRATGAIKMRCFFSTYGYWKSFISQNETTRLWPDHSFQAHTSSPLQHAVYGHRKPLLQRGGWSQRQRFKSIMMNYDASRRIRPCVPQRSCFANGQLLISIKMGEQWAPPSFVPKLSPMHHQSHFIGSPTHLSPIALVSQYLIIDGYMKGMLIGLQ